MLEDIYLVVGAAMLAVSLLIVRFSYLLLRRLRRHAERAPSAFQPRVTLIIPCKGAEADLAEHLAAHFQHDYPCYEIIFAVADAQDPALAVIRAVIAQHPQVPASVVVAPRRPHCVEKVSNQLAAVAAADPRCEVLAFADSDGEPRDRSWLRALVAPLETHMVATGFRWYFPTAGTLAGRLQSAWDSSWCILHAVEGTVWGGAMALTRQNFERLRLEEHLSRAITDDLVVLNRARAEGGQVFFTPGAMVASEPHQRLRDFVGWAVRQSVLVKVVAPTVWLRGFLIATLFASFYLLTAALLIWPGDRFERWLPGGVLAAVVLLNLWRCRLRYPILAGLFPGWTERLRAVPWRYTWFVPLSDWLSPYIACRSLLTRTIWWRGVGYRVSGGQVVRVGAGNQPA